MALDPDSTQNPPEFPPSGPDVLPPLVTQGDPRLAKASEPVNLAEIKTEGFLNKLETLHEALIAYEGIGIAAPQIGWFERVFFMLSMPDGVENEEEEGDLECWVNPVVVEMSQEQGWAWEGCLSVPGFRGWIKRPLTVKVQGLTLHGKPVTREYNGWNARVFQHEYDHLDGWLYTYRAADPRHIVSLEALEHRASWPEDWPAKGASVAPMGVVLPE